MSNENVEVKAAVGRPTVVDEASEKLIVRALEASKQGDLANVSIAHALLTQTDGPGTGFCQNWRKQNGMDSPMKLSAIQGKSVKISAPTIRSVAEKLGIAVRGQGRPAKGNSVADFLGVEKPAKEKKVKATKKASLVVASVVSAPGSEE